MSERHFQASAGTEHIRLDVRYTRVDGKTIKETVAVNRCHDCSSGETLYCGRTGKKIKWPISGPIESWCPLRRQKRVEEEDQEA